MRMTLLTVVASVTLAGSAQAATTVYSNRALFATAAGTTQTEDFNTFTTSTSFATTPVTAGVITVSRSPNGETSDRNAIGISTSAEANVNGTPDIDLFNTITSPSVFLTFSSAIIAFGADLQGLNNAGQSRIFINGQSYDPGTTGPTALNFFGLTSDTPFTTVEIRSTGNERAGVDNVSYQFGANAVPEPATWAMMMLGFGGVGYAMRRKNKVARRVRFA